MINFREINEDNFDEIINMKRPIGENFVASNEKSLAQCWLYRNDNDVFPLAIYDDEKVVGFILLEEDLGEKRLDLWRIMFPIENESKGYGSSAIRLLIDYCRNCGKYQHIYLLCNEKNLKAKHVYEKLGFYLTGEVCFGDLEMRIDL